MLTYVESLDALQAATARGMIFDLSRTVTLLDILGSPHGDLDSGVLVAGTNGKGSVCATVDSICRAAGLTSVLHTSPHLCSYRERIVVDGQAVSPERFADLATRVIAAAETLTNMEAGPPTQHEMLTAMGILAAAEHKTDVFVCEVGLGGRLDSSNVLDLGVTAITSISFDHMKILGSTIAEIAKEKAGIIKPDNDVVTSTVGESLGIIERVASSVAARRCLRVGREIVIEEQSVQGSGIDMDIAINEHHLHVTSALRGEHQIANTAVAIGVCDALRSRGHDIPDDAITRGCATVRWPARLQWLEGNPSWLIDGAHNVAGMEALVAAIPAICGDRPRTFLFSVMADKEVLPILHLLRHMTDDPIFTQATNPRAADPTDLVEQWGAGAQAEPSLSDALDMARHRTPADGVIIVCGSLYFAGDVLNLLNVNPAGKDPGQ